MGCIDKLRKLFLYAGVEKEEYESLLPSFREENMTLLRLFSQLAAVMFFLLFIVSMVSVGFFTTNNWAYLCSALGMLAILFNVVFVLPKHPNLVMVFVYIFEVILFAFGIYISILHADKPAVSAVAFLLVTPLLFYDRPIRLASLIVAAVVGCCALVIAVKDPAVASIDIWNMITFGTVALAVAVFIMSIKMRTLLQSKQIAYLSQTDLLTGTKNRNHYEGRLQDYPGMCSSNLICLYGDVNGLHEMNNRLGHHAGDKMLCEVAAELVRHFGEEHTYRIGGDEFVAFRVDGKPEEMAAEVGQLQRDLGEKGYSVSFGVAAREKQGQDELNMKELVKAAEEGMFVAKRSFYSQVKNDRRSR